MTSARRLRKVIPAPDDARNVEDVIASWTADAAVLRRCGHAGEAVIIEQLIADLTGAVVEFTTWLTEVRAIVYTGKSAEWLRGRYAALEARGLAATRNGLRSYRRAALPHRDYTGGRD